MNELTSFPVSANESWLTHYMGPNGIFFIITISFIIGGAALIIAYSRRNNIPSRLVDLISIFEQLMERARRFFQKPSEASNERYDNPTNKISWYIYKNKTFVRGPFHEREMSNLIHRGELSCDALIMRSGDPKWGQLQFDAILLPHLLASTLDGADEEKEQQQTEGNEKPITARLSFRLTAVAFALFMGVSVIQGLINANHFSPFGTIWHTITTAVSRDNSMQPQATASVQSNGDVSPAEPDLPAKLDGSPQLKSEPGPEPKPPKLDGAAILSESKDESKDQPLRPKPPEKAEIAPVPKPPETPVEKPAPKPPKLDEVAKLLAEKPKLGEESAERRPSPDLAEISRLLSREAPSSVGSAGRELNRTASLGAPNASAARMSPSMSGELNFLMQEQYKQCWSLPPSNGPRYVAKIHITYRPDGSLASEPALINSPSDPQSRSLAESALRAVRRCNPLKIPARFQPYFEQWKDWVVGFDPDNM